MPDAEPPKLDYPSRPPPKPKGPRIEYVIMGLIVAVVFVPAIVLMLVWWLRGPL